MCGRLSPIWSTGIGIDPVSGATSPYEIRSTEQARLIIKIAPSDDAQAKAAEDAAERKSKATSDWWLIILTALLAIATIALVVVTGGLVWFAWRQAGDMQRSIAAAEKAAEAALGAALPALNIAEVNIIDPIRADRDLRWRMVFRNDGGSFAYVTRWRLGFYLGQLPSVDDRGWIDGEPQGVLPQETLRLEADRPIHFNSDHFENIKDGRLKPIVFAFVNYEDLWRRKIINKRRDGFYLELIPKNLDAFTFELTPKFN